MICYHPYPAPYYMRDTVNLQTQKVSKIPPFDGTVFILILFNINHCGQVLVVDSPTLTQAISEMPFMTPCFMDCNGFYGLVIKMICVTYWQKDISEHTKMILSYALGIWFGLLYDDFFYLARV